MKLKLFGLFLLFISFNSFSQNFEWVKTFGNNTNNDYATRSAVDMQGNIYTAGRFYGTIDFDSGSATYNVTSVSNHDGYITKINSAGVLQWVKTFGGYAVKVDIKDVKTDSFGNIYVTGTFSGAVDFNPNAGKDVFTAINNDDIFIVKLDAGGNYLWAKSFIGDYYQTANSIAVDRLSNIYLTGGFEYSLDFDPSAATQQLSSKANSEDVFVLKLNSIGDLQWVRSIGGIDTDEAKSLTIDSLNNVLVTGIYKSTADFDPGAAIRNMTSLGSFDTFILKLDSSGSFIWSKSLGGIYDDLPAIIRVDKLGNVFTTGYFFGTADFDPGTNTYNFSTGYMYIPNPFLSKLSSEGQFIWAKSYPASNALGMCIDGSGNIFVSGNYIAEVDFNPGAGKFNVTSTSTGPGGYSGDIYITKFNNSGDHLWAIGIGGKSLEENVSLDIDNSGNIFLTGNFYETVDFDPGNSQANSTSYGGYDAFVLKLNEGVVLPLNVSDFKSTLDEFGVNLSWYTLSESNGRGLIVERSRNSIDFKQIQEIPFAGKPCKYSVIDKEAFSFAGNDKFIYYRIKIVSPDGSLMISDVVTVNLKNIIQNKNMQLFPIPTENVLNVSYKDTFNGYSYKIIDMVGKELISGRLKDGFTSIDLSKLSTGTYFFKVDSKGEHPVIIVKK